MPKITQRQLRAAEWNKQFEHGDFRVFTTPLVPGLRLVHAKGKAEYRFDAHGVTRTTDSLFQLARWINEAAKGRNAPPGSVQSIRSKREGSNSVLDR